MKFFFALLLLSLLAVPAFAARLSNSDRQWIDRCVANHRADKLLAKAARRYCDCMHTIVETNAALTQSAMERAYPPAHRLCRRQAGWQ